MTSNYRSKEEQSANAERIKAETKRTEAEARKALAEAKTAELKAKKEKLELDKLIKAEEKIKALSSAGVAIVPRPGAIGTTLQQAII